VVPVKQGNIYFHIAPEHYTTTNLFNRIIQLTILPTHQDWLFDPQSQPRKALPARPEVVAGPKLAEGVRLIRKKSSLINRVARVLTTRHHLDFSAEKQAMVQESHTQRLASQAMLD
jgi:hypothetical protein